MPIGGAASGGAPAVHGALHLGDGADPIDWSTVHGRGSLGAIPAASADNEGYLYFSTSDSVLYRSTGSIWESVAQAPDSDLAALAALTGTGLVARTGAGTAATRTLQAGSGITIANGDGVAGDPSIAANPGKVGGLFVWCHSYGQLSGIPGATLGIGGNERAGNFTRRFAAALGVPSSEILLIGKSGAQAASPQIGDTGEQQGVGAVLRWWSPQHLYSGQNQALRWTSRARGAFCAVMLGVNDPARDTSGLSLGITLNAYKHGIRTAVSRLRAAAVAFYNDATIAYTGTWSDVTTTTASRGTVKRTSTLNDFFTITLPPTFRGGVVGLVYHGNVNTGSAPAATTGTTVTYSGTAGVTGTTVLAGQGCAGARIQVTHRVTLTAAAAGKTIIGTLTAKNSGETLDFDSWHIEDDNHAGVMLVNQPLQWFASTAGFFAPHNIVLLAPYGYDFNDGLAAVAAEFPSSVFVADAEAYFDARFKATVSGAITANATPNLAAQTIRIIPTNAALCTIDVGSILRVRAKEEFLVTAKDTTNGGLNDGKWLLTVTRNYTGSNESGTDATNNVATSSGEAIFDCSWLLPDRIHPSDYGHALLAEVMIRAFASISYSETNAAKSGQFALSDHPKPPDGDCYYWPRGGTRTTITAGQQTRSRRPVSASTRSACSPRSGARSRRSAARAVPASLVSGQTARASLGT
jgi:hypothetical protein